MMMDPHILADHDADDPKPKQGVRVLRLLEYTYPDVATAERDMARWTHSAPSNVHGMTMRSTILPFEAIEWVAP